MGDYTPSQKKMIERYLLERNPAERRRRRINAQVMTLKFLGLVAGLICGCASAIGDGGGSLIVAMVVLAFLCGLGVLILNRIKDNP
jgi:predicted Co/Zn/Cd cation transporter (cation efflux family)